MPVLYRKYRPQRFADVADQNHIKITLGNEIAHGNLAHAYLFVGPRGTGKTTMARLLARSVNCLKREAGTFEPCNSCDSCKLIVADRSLDIMEIDAATHTQVDNVRDNIIASTRIPPLSPTGYKVFIIDEIHMLSKHAFNALLKTIEEPPARVIFILATTDIYKVPETVISRCQRFDFKKIPQKLIVDRLLDICFKEGVGIPTSIVTSIARKSEGCMRDAESLLGQVLSIAEKGEVSEESANLIIPKSNWQTISGLVGFLQQRNVSAALESIHFMIQEGMDCETYIADLIEYLRQLLLKKSIGAGFRPDFDDQTVTTITEQTQSFSLPELKRLVEIFLREAYRTKNAMIPQLPLELGCIEFCQEALMDHSEPLPADPAIETANSITAPSLVLSRDIASLRKEWQSILDELKALNHSLSVFLKVAHPLQTDAAKVVVGFKYDFHANTIRENKNRVAAEQAFSRVLKRPVTIDCIIDTNYTENHKNFNGGTEPDVQDVLSIMGGGEII